MAITLEQLIQAQKQIQALFLRPVGIGSDGDKRHALEHAIKGDPSVDTLIWFCPFLPPFVFDNLRAMIP